MVAGYWWGLSVRLINTIKVMWVINFGNFFMGVNGRYSNILNLIY